MNSSDRLERPLRIARSLVCQIDTLSTKHRLTLTLELPERLIIYHAGTGRTTFMAMLKITTLFMGAFFCFIVAPSYIKAGKPEWSTASGTPSPLTRHFMIRPHD